MLQGTLAAHPGTMPRALTAADIFAEMLDAAAQARAAPRGPIVPAAPLPPAAPGPVALARLLERHGNEFVVGAYADLLGRTPDADALVHYRTALLNGGFSKVAILGMLRYSAEGRRHGRPVPGLARRFLLHRTYAFPVLGRALRTLVAVLVLPRLLRDVQRLEQQNALNQERIARLERALAASGAPGHAAVGPGR